MAHSVYRVLLDNDVWKDKKFREVNPVALENNEAYYVGSTGKPIDKRFGDHKKGYKHNKYVKEFGKHVELVSEHTTWAEAHKKEIEAAMSLRKQGKGVFQR